MRKLVFPRITRSEYVNGNIKETCFRNVFACFRKCYHKVTLAETLVSSNGNSTETYKKVVRFRCNRSDGNMSKRDVSASVNMCKPSCFRDGVTCLRNVSVCGFLFFRPVQRFFSRHEAGQRPPDVGRRPINERPEDFLAARSRQNRRNIRHSIARARSASGTQGTISRSWKKYEAIIKILRCVWR